MRGILRKNTNPEAALDIDVTKNRFSRRQDQEAETNAMS